MKPTLELYDELEKEGRFKALNMKERGYLVADILWQRPATMENYQMKSSPPLQVGYPTGQAELGRNLRCLA